MLDPQVKIQIIAMAKEKSMGPNDGDIDARLAKFKKVYEALRDIVEDKPTRNEPQSDPVSYQ